jgi:Fic family protein
LIVSPSDEKMRILCTLEEEMIHLLTSISEKKGEMKAYFLNQPEPHSIEESRIDSVHATIYLQNRNLSREKTADIIRDLSVRAFGDSIREIKNTLHLYENLSTYNPYSQNSFKLAHSDLLNEQGTHPAYREEIVHFYHWTGFIGMSLPCKEMRKGMNELFHYLRHGKVPLLIKSCLCHYAIQFYQPFENENEKMSRLWQSLLLMKEHPSFEYLPWEKEILIKKKEYYSRLPDRDRNIDASEFVKYMLRIIDTSLATLLESCRKSVRPMDRIRYFYNLGPSDFTRRDYMKVHKNISTATASRDLDLGVETGYFTRHGMNNQTTYRCYLWFE